MDIFAPNKKLWIPDNEIADSLASPIGISRMLKWNRSRRICHLTPHRVMMGASGASGGAAASYDFDGTGDRLTTPDHASWSFGSGDFTIDHHVRFDALSNQGIVGQASSGQISWATSYKHSGTELRFTYSTNGTAQTHVTESWTPSVSVWYHLTFLRSGNNLRLYVDGTQLGSDTDLTGVTFHASTAQLVIGDNDASIGGAFNGRLDEIRIRKGTAITPPSGGATAEYSDGVDDLLIHCHETIVSGTTGSGATFNESGVNNVLMTEVANAIRDEAEYKF